MTTRIWIHGRRPVLEALDAGIVRRVLVASGRDPSPILREIVNEANAHGAAVDELPESEIARRTRTGSAQGVMAEVELPQAISVTELRARIVDPAFLLVLDQVQDPHNLGALLRTADAAGVHAVLLPERRSAAVTAAVLKTSAGAAARVPISEAVNLARALDQLRRDGIWTVGLEATSNQSLYDLDLSVAVALVLGGEGSGLRRLTRERCDFLAHIPMHGSVGSLNVSVAGGIAMFETLRQRLGEPKAAGRSVQ